MDQTRFPLNIIGKTMSDDEMYASACGRDDASDIEELLQLGMTCEERLDLEANSVPEARVKDKKYIDQLEGELRNCSQQIGYLLDQLNLRTTEADCMSEQVHSLELKLGEVELLHEKLWLLGKELEKSDSRSLTLIQAIKDGEYNCSLHVEKLERELSSIALESQCEIESMKLDITTLEQRCLEAERLTEQAALDKARMNFLLEELEVKFQEAQEKVSYLEKENKVLRGKLVTSVENVKGSSCKAEHLNNWLKLLRRMSGYIPGGSSQEFIVNMREELMVLKEMSTCEEVVRPFLLELVLIASLDKNTKKEMEKMSNQIHESELAIVHLKEELREEKQKAKEEAEDLIQEMAELRYQMTDMLEEECKRRACIEQASLQRIKDLEAQLLREQKVSAATLKRFKEVHKLAEMRSMEIKHLKNALEGIHRRSKLEIPPGVKSCACDCCMSSCHLCCSRVISGNAEASDDICDGNFYRQGLIEWYPDEAPPMEGQDESLTNGSRTNDIIESLRLVE